MTVGHRLQMDEQRDLSSRALTTYIKPCVPSAACSAVATSDTVFMSLAVDRQQHVADAHARAVARESRRDVVGDHDVVPAPRPEHAVIELADPGLDERDVDDRHADKRRRHGHG